MARTITKSGPKPKYPTAKDWKKKIDGYFAEVEPPWTVTGLALHLDYCRESLNQLIREDEGQDRAIIALLVRAKDKIFENQCSNALNKDYDAGMVKFLAMNNHGFRSEKHQVLTVELPPINFNG